MSVSIMASYRGLLASEKSQVQIIPNVQLAVNYCSRTKGISKYKKVSKAKKELLINYIISQGRSIIESAKTLGINYSTAKSIILNHKKRKPQDSELDTTSQLNGGKGSNHLDCEAHQLQSTQST